MHGQSNPEGPDHLPQQRKDSWRGGAVPQPPGVSTLKHQPAAHKHPPICCFCCLLRYSAWKLIAICMGTHAHNTYTQMFTCKNLAQKKQQCFPNSDKQPTQSFAIVHNHFLCLQLLLGTKDQSGVVLLKMAPLVNQIRARVSDRSMGPLPEHGISSSMKQSRMPIQGHRMPLDQLGQWYISCPS